jgi:4-phosphopantoate---beta-alanine ligase
VSRIPRSHPRYRSLVTRARLAQAGREGVVVPEGLIAHGRGEAYDYLLGEATTPSARIAERTAAVWLAEARHPVLSVNGNVAALASKEVAQLARAVPALRVEVNLFHRTPARARAIERRLRAAGVPEVLGVRPTARIPGLPSDRAAVDARGVLLADVCLIPLEDGDRTEALQRLGKRVIAIDLNPLSRTAQRADLTIVDELTRALSNIARSARDQRSHPRRMPAPSSAWFLSQALLAIGAEIKRRAAPSPRPRQLRAPARSAGRPRSGSRRRSRRRPPRPARPRRSPR